MATLQGRSSPAPHSRLHAQRSFDPADFPVPTGREEEWRFTPLRRLRSLHAEGPLPPGRSVPRSMPLRVSPLCWRNAATPGSAPPTYPATG